MTETTSTHQENTIPLSNSLFAIVQKNLLTSFPKPLNTMSFYFSPEPIFSTIECINIISLGNKLNLEYQKNTTNVIDTNMFNTKTNYFLYDNNQEINYFYDKIREEVIKANNLYWLFNLYDFGEPLKFMEYSSEYNAFVKMHTDLAHIGVTKFRKLTIIVQLSDEDDYDGGNLVVQNYENFQIMPRKRGTIIIFPSFLLHKVEPVTRGIRNSLVTFAYGPPFC
jgi:PKHD-type hydroxylase